MSFTQFLCIHFIYISVLHHGNIITINEENNDFCSEKEKNTIKLLLKCAIIAKLFCSDVGLVFFCGISFTNFKNKNKSVTSKLPTKKKQS